MAKPNKESSQLLQDITGMMTDPSQAQNENKIDNIMSRIRKLNIDKASEEVRLASCHFMTMFHTRKAMTIGGPSQGGMGGGAMGGMGMGGPPQSGVNMKLVHEFKKAQKKDMELGWDLLNIKNSNSQAAKTARVLKIEVAQRLEDSNKLKQAFDDLISRNLSQEELMVVFTAAPFLGEWKQMMKLGKKIEKIQGGMDQLHLMSLQLPIPDFTLVYDLCKKHKLQNTIVPKISELTWELFNVKSIRVKFKSVDCGEFEEKKKELMDEINKQGKIEWENVPSIDHVHIKRMGALCQAVSFGEIPMMLNGPWLSSKINVKGRTEMPLMPEGMQGMQGMGGMMPPNMDPSKVTILVQEEEWNLELDKNNNNKYIGKYTLNQRPELPKGKKKTPEHAPVNMTFDCEIIVEKTNEEQLYNNNNNNNNNKSIKNDNNNDNNDEKKNNNDNYEEEEVMEQEEDDIAPIVTEFDGLELD